MKQCWKAVRTTTGFGCHMPVTRMSFDETVGLLGSDLSVARGRVAAGDKPSYFSGKASLIQECMKEHEGRRSAESRDGLLVGYAPGHKYLYKGLPISLAIGVDRAIIEIIDLIARCEHVVLTGYCCAGHPSMRVPNPCPGNPQVSGEKHIYTQNFSPYFKVMLPRNEAGDTIVEMLCGIRTETAYRGMSIGIAAEMNGTGRLHEEVMVLPITGVPTLHCARAVPAHQDVVALYQRALADFWRAVKRVFEDAARERIDGPKPDEFGHAVKIKGDLECALIAERRLRGMAQPNYVYFNGIIGATKPVAG